MKKQIVSVLFANARNMRSKDFANAWLAWVFLASCTLPVVGIAQTTTDEMDHSKMDHSKMNHTTMIEESQASETPVMTEAGNDAFGTIQEVLNSLMNDPRTDWALVNIEALRLHLQDMDDMTLNVEVISQEPVFGGMIAVVRATTPRAEKALARVFQAHPMQLEKETGWKMQVEFNEGKYTLTTTTENPEDVNKIRGFGYIGLMAYGNHHQPHHWAMATGKNPHDHSH